MHRCKHPDLSPSATSTTAHPRSHVVNFGLRCCVQEAKAAWNAALQCADAHTDIQLLLDLSLALKDPQAAKVGGWPTSEEPHSRQAHTGISCVRVCRKVRSACMGAACTRGTRSVRPAWPAVVMPLHTG